MSTAQKKYYASKQECLAVVWELNTLRPYLMFETFMVHADHRSLRWLFGITEPLGKLTRWRLIRAELDFPVA